MSDFLQQSHQAHVDQLVFAYADILRSWGKKNGVDGVVVHAGTAVKKSIFDDQDWPLSVVPHFKHWLPLAVAGCAVWIVPGKKPVLFYRVDRDFWDGPPEPETDHFFHAFDVREVRSDRDVRDALSASVGRCVFVGEDKKAAAAMGFAEDRIAPADLLKHLDELRVAKTPYEVHCLREANRRACLGHAAVLAAFADGDHSELDLHLLYLRATQQDDPETPYKNIVALNEHAATLHHVSYGRKKTSAQSLLLDAGATYQGYDSDITRTAVKGAGEAADAFRALVAGVEKLQQQLCLDAKVGRPYEQLHDDSHQMLASVLCYICLFRGASA
jgi:Xaa-Pro dipeptidase